MGIPGKVGSQCGNNDGSLVAVRIPDPWDSSQSIGSGDLISSGMRADFSWDDTYTECPIGIILVVFHRVEKTRSNCPIAFKPGILCNFFRNIRNTRYAAKSYFWGFMPVLPHRVADPANFYGILGIKRTRWKAMDLQRNDLYIVTSKGGREAVLSSQLSFRSQRCRNSFFIRREAKTL